MHLNKLKSSAVGYLQLDCSMQCETQTEIVRNNKFEVLMFNPVLCFAENSSQGFCLWSGKKLIHFLLCLCYPHSLFSFSFPCAIFHRRVGFYVNTFKNVSSLEAKFHKEIALVSKMNVSCIMEYVLCITANKCNTAIKN